MNKAQGDPGFSKFINRIAELGRKYYPSAIEGLVESQGALLEYTMIVLSFIQNNIGAVYVLFCSDKWRKWKIV